MDIFIHIVVDVILPLLLVIRAGAYLHRLFHSFHLSDLPVFFDLHAKGVVLPNSFSYVCSVIYV
ncbi:hypothetical protein AF2641_09590 [Anoxybacillus flavithermus]|nr:hypothetical protein AF2641_09590 [Anoxybacillus flavithermus]